MAYDVVNNLWLYGVYIAKWLNDDALKKETNSERQNREKSFHDQILDYWFLFLLEEQQQILWRQPNLKCQSAYLCSF